MSEVGRNEGRQNSEVAVMRKQGGRKKEGVRKTEAGSRQV
jgi:hypothetical protein